MSLFISHGAPTLLLDDTPAHRFLKALGGDLPRSRAIIVVSAHWESNHLQIGNDEAHSLIRDFSGFPRALYEFQWSATGDSNLALNLQTSLEQAGFNPELVTGRGLDHGAWVPLSLMDPTAATPVVPVSLPVTFTESQLWRLGQILTTFEKNGYRVVGTGSLTHNLRARAPAWHARPNPQILPFIDAITTTLRQDERQALRSWQQFPDARQHHPTPEHFLPLLVAAAAPGPSQRLHHSVEYGVLAMDCWQFGEID